VSSVKRRRVFGHFEKNAPPDSRLGRRSGRALRCLLRISSRDSCIHDSGCRRIRRRRHGVGVVSARRAFRPRKHCCGRDHRHSKRPCQQQSILDEEFAVWHRSRRHCRSQLAFGRRLLVLAVMPATNLAWPGFGVREVELLTDSSPKTAIAPYKLADIKPSPCLTPSIAPVQC